MARSAEMRIGDLSRLTGCNVETIRYYERVGLLPHPPRSAARYRLYDSADVRRLTFARRARELGFTPDEVRNLLALAVADGKTPAPRCVRWRRATLAIFAPRSPICALWSRRCPWRFATAMPASFPAVH